MPTTIHGLMQGILVSIIIMIIFVKKQPAEDVSDGARSPVRAGAITLRLMCGRRPSNWKRSDVNEAVGIDHDCVAFSLEFSLC